MTESWLGNRAQKLCEALPSLRAYLEAIAVETDERIQALHDITLNVLESDRELRSSDIGRSWLRHLEFLEQGEEAARRPEDCAVVANALALIALNRVRDYRDLAFAASLLGHDAIAEHHHRLDARLSTAEDLPLGTALLHLLNRPRPAQEDGSSRRASLELSGDELAACHTAGVALALAGLRPARRPRHDPILTPGGFEYIAHSARLGELREHLAPIAADPWGAHAQSLARLLPHVESPDAARLGRACLERLRKQAEAQEQRQVADTVRRLVKTSGLSQRAFAARVGTSPSRMSTYVNGQVTPSAAMFVRMARVSKVIASDHGQDRDQEADLDSEIERYLI